MDLVPARTASSAGWSRRLFVTATWLLAVACGLWAGLRLSGVDGPWPLPVLLAVTPWAVALAGVTLVGAVVTRARVAAVVAAAGMLVLAAVVVPRAWGSADHRDGLTLRVMTANLHIGDADPATIVRWCVTTG